MNPKEEQVWNSSDGKRRVQVTWTHDGAQVVCVASGKDQGHEAWELRFDDDSLASVSMDGRTAANGEVSPRIISHQFPELPEPICLDVGRPMQFGRSFVAGPRQNPEIITLHNPAVALEHCVLFRAPGADDDDVARTKPRYCLVDLGNDTLVNQRPIHACLLRSGDLIQIGPFGFVFALQTSRPAGFLLPVSGIEGVRLELRDVKLDKLGPISLCVNCGEMVAVVGPSGSGKSTFLRAISSLTGPRSGTITCDDKDIRRESAWFRSLLGYVSQSDVVPSDATALEVVKFSATLREFSPSASELKGVLRQVDVPDVRWDAKPSSLSGGERKRVKIAAELIASPRLLIMDEPASGLDRNRETSLLRMLRTLRNRGCTILVITHNLRTLDWFDRVCVIRDGRIATEGSPGELRRMVPSGDLDDLYLLEKPTSQDAAPTITDAGNPNIDLSPFHDQDPVRQFKTLWLRERVYLTNAWFKRLVLPLLIVPVIFGFAIGLAVQRSDRSLLGFLSLLACIWMSASNSLMAIVDERDVYEHERLLFLRNRSYVISKAAMYLLLSGLQTIVFMLALHSSRGLTNREQLYCWGSACVVLAVVGWSATGVGLFISAISKFSKSAATLLLPLFMMAQIVFSVFIGDPGAARDKTDVNEVYQNYEWVSSTNVQGASNWARRASYLTLTRYGDRALRSFAYHEESFTPPLAIANLLVLLASCGVSVFATWVCLATQNRWVSIAFNLRPSRRWIKRRYATLVQPKETGFDRPAA